MIVQGLSRGVVLESGFFKWCFLILIHPPAFPSTEHRYLVVLFCVSLAASSGSRTFDMVVDIAPAKACLCMVLRVFGIPCLAYTLSSVSPWVRAVSFRTNFPLCAGGHWPRGVLSEDNIGGLVPALTDSDVW